VVGLSQGDTSSLLQVGGQAVTASWSGIDGSSTRTLSYTVAAGDNGQAVLDTAALQAALVAGLKDLAGNAYVVSGNLSAPSLPVIDSTAPLLTSNTPAVALSTVVGSSGNSEGETVTLSLSFNGPVQGLSSGTTLGLVKVGDTPVSATWVGEAGSSARTLSYTVAAGHNGQLTLDMSALQTALVQSIQDAAGNALALTAGLQSPDLPLIDTTAPTLSATLPSVTLSTVSGQAGDSAGEAITLTLRFDSPVNGLSTGSTDAVFSVNGTAVSATWGGTDGSSLRTLSYTVAPGDNGQASIDEAAILSALTQGLRDSAGNALFTSTLIVPVAIT
jgi:hypothetical protein